ncbi:MAG: BON domain-containing protein [Proteobacteria bacterium]|jgi:osmotically-inducible protein OsmY|nr:BON domain-containing protein [Pseudomonadota bacterium]
MKVSTIADYISRFVCAIMLLTALSGCIAAAIGAVTVASVDVVHDRRTAGEYFDDGAIEATFKQFIVRDSSLRKSTHINGTSFNGIFLLTGELPDENTKQQITDYATNIQGVRQVVDETRISGKTAFFSRTNDTWLTAKVKSILLKELQLDATRIKVKSEYGNVYLMGIVTPEEAGQVTQIASGVRGVVRVIKVFEYQS